MSWGHMADGGWLFVSVFWLVLVAVVVFTAVRLPRERRGGGDDADDAGVIALIGRLGLDESVIEEPRGPLRHSG
jgi:hypothetical protein